ncbi:MAG: hypothetical protein IT572_00195 [Deltaproteobacteria bacterium]|nr:hypothetical protein [Deltaproteobacteria bacterium]
MKSNQLKGFIAALALLSCLSSATPLIAQDLRPTSTPVEYQGLLDFTKALPTDLKAGNAGTNVLFTQILASFFSPKQEAGFAKQAAVTGVRSDSSRILSPEMFLGVLRLALSPEREEAMDARVGFFNFDKDTANLSSFTQNRIERKIESKDGFSGFLSGFPKDLLNPTADATVEFQNPFVFKK